MHAVVYLVHLAAPFVGDVDAMGRTLEEEAHAVAVLYLDTHGARLAVTAAAAEVAAELAAVFLYLGAHGVVEHRWVVLIREPLVQLALLLDAPDRRHLVLRQPGVGRVGVGDEAAGESFHADEAHVGLEGATHDVEVGVGGQIAEGVLEGLVEAALYSLYGNPLTVVGEADMTHLALPLRFQHSFVQAAAVARSGAEGQIMELVEVHIVGT